MKRGTVLVASPVRPFPERLARRGLTCQQRGLHVVQDVVDLERGKGVGDVAEEVEEPFGRAQVAPAAAHEAQDGVAGRRKNHVLAGIVDSLEAQSIRLADLTP